jgi:hypothetical protein
MVQIDTTEKAGWEDGIHSDNTASPLAGVVIDSFSDPSHYDGVTYKEYAGDSAYYIPSMSTAGSTDVTIDGCDRRQFLISITWALTRHGQVAC